MALWHLEKLRASLERRGWSCADLPGDNYAISATWELRRPRDHRVLHVDFEGLDDMRTLPIEQSYGCKLRETGAGLYFRRQRTVQLWEEELSAFVEALEQ
jgi:hypothetical protein